MLGAVKPVNKTAVFRFIPKKNKHGENTCKNKQHKLFSNMMSWKFLKVNIQESIMEIPMAQIPVTLASTNAVQAAW